MHDPYDLQRFLSAQDPVYAHVLEELRSGEKRSHWMWFIFPQLQGLGRSAMAVKYAITSLGEAQVYLDHPILGSRLRECTDLVNGVRGRRIDQIFGYPDDLKFHSSMTLFSTVAPDMEVFDHALQQYFGGQRDALTLDRLASK